MSRKENFTPDQWKLLLDVPPLVGTAVMMAGNSGLGTVKEAFAIASGVLAARHGYEGNQLIEDLIQGRLKEGDRSEVEKFSNQYRGMNAEQVIEAAVQKCELVAALLDEFSDPQEADQFKAWTMSVGQNVAEAAKEGGVLGFGGERVSPQEQEVLDRVQAALRSAS